jgi:hypothetical protein
MSKSLLPSLMSAFRAGRKTFRESRLGSQHTNGSSLWQGATRRTGHRPISSIFSHLPSMRSRCRVPGISSMTTAQLETALTQRRAIESPSQPTIDNQSLPLAAWIPPYYPSDLHTEGRCRQALAATYSGKKKTEMELTRLVNEQASLAASLATSQNWVRGLLLCSVNN